MQFPRPRLSLLTLALLPAMFAAGWWCRGINYNRDVYIAAEYIAMESGGIYIPEIGLFHGGQKMAQRLGKLSQEGEAELARRIEYDDRMLQYYDDELIPPQPSLLDAALELVPEGLKSKVQSYSIPPDNAPATALGTLDELGVYSQREKNEAAQRAREEFFERVRKR